MYLASGGNDNKLLVWDHKSTNEGSPVQTYTDHQAAVKAIAWSPHHHGLLARSVRSFSGRNNLYVFALLYPIVSVFSVVAGQLTDTFVSGIL